MKLFFWKNRYQFQSDNEAFSNYLNFEIRGNELLRSQILILLFAFLAIGIALLALINPPYFHIITNHNIHLYLGVFFIAVLVYELVVKTVIQRAIRRKRARWLQFLRYFNATEEATFPTVGIAVLAAAYNPTDAILGPGPYFYFIFILMGTLRLDFGLSVFTGVMSGLQFFGLGMLLTWMFEAGFLSPFLSMTLLTKSGLMATAGVLTGIVSLEIKKRIHDSFLIMAGYNRTLEEKVQARTAELETLNRELQEKIEAGVKKRREQEQLIIQQSKMSAMGELIGMIAHQWRQPLSNIGTLVGNMQVLFDLEQLEESEFHRFVQEINEQTQYLSTTITDFRRFLSTTKKLEYASLGDLVNNALKIIGKSLENKNISLKLACPIQTEILTFPNELVQVFINILKNAQDALLENRVEKPLIEIRGEEQNQQQTLYFRDNAGGIPEEIIDRIFDPYFTTKEKQDGTGLGLYMSRTIIETHCHGTLTVENVNHGAQFRIDLPTTPKQAPVSELKS